MGTEVCTQSYSGAKETKRLPEVTCGGIGAHECFSSITVVPLPFIPTSRGTAEDDAQFVTLTYEVATCNTTRTGPKAYLAPFEDGTRYGLIAECNVVASSGLTEAQLDAFCETSMEMILSFFHDLELAHPEMVTWSDNTQGAQA